MRTEIQKYPAYKDSGVEWLGEIPCHWEVKKLKFIGNIYAGLNGKKGDDFTKEFSSGIKSYIPFTNICNNLKISENQFHFVKVNENEKQNKVLIYDILFLMSSETLEDIGKNSIYVGNNEELYLNSFCKGFRILSNRVNPEYVNYLFSSLTYRSYFSLVGRGFTRINLKQEFINDSFALLPPLSEQTAIAAFLDRKTALIDQAIDIKQKQIELLKERRQILIHKAVTRGLNPNVKMKDSGVEWIGEVPEGWEVKKLRYLANCFPSNIDKHSKPNEKEVRLCNYTDVYKNDFITDDMELMIATATIEQIAKFTLKEGDIVITKDSETANDIAVPTYIKEKLTNVVCGYHLAVIRTNQESYSKYLFQALKTKLFNAQFEVCSNGITRVGLGNSDLKNGYFLLPSKQEQIEIAEYIETGVKKIATAITLKEQEIEKLKEYKGTLINSAVTGKVKV